MMELLLASDNPLAHVLENPHSILRIGGDGPFAFTYFSNQIFMQIVAAVLLIWLIPKAVAGRRGTDEIGRHVPTRFGSAIETTCIALRDHIFKPNLGPYTNAFTPFLWSLFFFLFAMNVLGLIPLSDWIGKLPGLAFVGGTATANIWVTGVLAALTLAMIFYNGLKTNGMVYVKHFFMGPPLLAWFIAILEFAGLWFKSMALCVRLFANMLAGHMILAVLLAFVAPAIASLGALGGGAVTIGVILGCVAFNLLELFVALLHAFIFTVLAAVFIGQAVNMHHDEHEHAHADTGDLEPAHAGAQH